jgi:hypothetical protein
MNVLIKMTHYRMLFRKKGRLKIKSLSTRILTYITQGTLTDRRQKKKNKEKTHTHKHSIIKKKKQFFFFFGYSFSVFLIFVLRINIERSQLKCIREEKQKN